jgi:peptidoglycan/LPS O-acetylase OafA/YrhL
MKNLKVFQTLNSSSRNSAVDVFRGLAIIGVVIYHYNHRLPYGFLGVDLFFLVSGLLVGGLLTKEFETGLKVNFFRFFLQRGFKIWPSYYAFIFLGTLLAIFFYSVTNPDQVIPLWDMKRYLFFYQNYTGLPFHWSFDHVWSLCVEEHFYIILPLMFLVIQNLISPGIQKKSLFLFVILTILAGIIFKFLSFYFTNSKDTFAGTHNRIDALAWGVLLNLIITYYGDRIKSLRFKLVSFLSGLLIFIAALLMSIYTDNILFEKIYFHSIVPFSFFLMLLGLYYVDFSRLKPIRFVAYYSYNWYLWHPVFIIFLTRHFGNTITGLLLYLAITFATAVLATMTIEETFLKKRRWVIEKVFGKQKKIEPVVVAGTGTAMQGRTTHT